MSYISRKVVSTPTVDAWPNVPNAKRFETIEKFILSKFPPDADTQFQKIDIKLKSGSGLSPSEMKLLEAYEMLYSLRQLEAKNQLDQTMINRLVQLSLWIRMSTDDSNLAVELDLLHQLLPPVPGLNKTLDFSFSLTERIPKTWISRDYGKQREGTWKTTPWREADVAVSFCRFDYDDPSKPPVQLKTKLKPGQSSKNSVTVFLAEEERLLLNPKGTEVSPLELGNSYVIEHGGGQPIQQRYTDADHFQAAARIKERLLSFIKTVNSSELLKELAIAKYPGELMLDKGEVVGTKKLWMDYYNCPYNIVLMDHSINSTDKSAADPIEWIEGKEEQFGEMFVQYLLNDDVDMRGVPSLRSLVDQSSILYTFKNDPRIRKEFRGKPIAEAIRGWTYRHNELLSGLLDHVESQDRMVQFLLRLQIVLDRSRGTEEHISMVRDVTTAAISEVNAISVVIRNTVRDLLRTGIDPLMIQEALWDDSPILRGQRGSFMPIDPDMFAQLEMSVAQEVREGADALVRQHKAEEEVRKRAEEAALRAAEDAARTPSPPGVFTPIPQYPADGGENLAMSGVSSPPVGMLSSRKRSMPSPELGSVSPDTFNHTSSSGHVKKARISGGDEPDEIQDQAEYEALKAQYIEMQAQQKLLAAKLRRFERSGSDV